MADQLQPNLNPFALAKELSNTLLIDGKLVPAKSGKVFGIVNPATGETIAEAADAGAADIDIAVKAASQAQKSWKTLHPRERGRLVGECGRPAGGP